MYDIKIFNFVKIWWNNIKNINYEKLKNKFFLAMVKQNGLNIEYISK